MLVQLLNLAQTLVLHHTGVQHTLIPAQGMGQPGQEGVMAARPQGWHEGARRQSCMTAQTLWMLTVLSPPPGWAQAAQRTEQATLQVLHRVVLGC